MWWRQGRALPYGEGVSFWALARDGEGAGGHPGERPLEVAREKLWASVDARRSARTTACGCAQHLLPLIGVEQPTRGERGRELAAWRRYFEGLAEQRPLVLVFEDLHWADDGLLDFVDHLADWAPASRSSSSAPRGPSCSTAGRAGAAASSTRRRSRSRRSPTPRRRRSSAASSSSALLPAETQQALLERAGGNPLYAEQFARLYVERGSTEDLPLPETIQGIIAARLDGLASRGEAAAPGRGRARQGVLVRRGGRARAAPTEPALEQALHSLERKGLIRRERRSAVGGEDEYAFRHVLVRDVAYGQIPRADRGEQARRRGSLARAARARGRPRRARRVTTTALRSSSPGRSASVDDVARGACTACLPPRRRPRLRLSAFPAAERFYGEALALWPDEPERPHVRLRARSGAVLRRRRRRCSSRLRRRTRGRRRGRDRRGGRGSHGARGLAQRAHVRRRRRCSSGRVRCVDQTGRHLAPLPRPGRVGAARGVRRTARRRGGI